MAGFVICGVLAAVGAMCVLWLAFGWLLPRPKGGLLVYWAPEANEEMVLRRYFWLRDLGLVRCRLIFVESSFSVSRQQSIMEKNTSVCFLTKEQWIEQEIENIG